MGQSCSSSPEEKQPVSQTHSAQRQLPPAIREALPSASCTAQENYDKARIALEKYRVEHELEKDSSAVGLRVSKKASLSTLVLLRLLLTNFYYRAEALEKETQISLHNEKSDAYSCIKVTTSGIRYHRGFAPIPEFDASRLDISFEGVYTTPSKDRAARWISQAKELLVVYASKRAAFIIHGVDVLPFFITTWKTGAVRQTHEKFLKSEGPANFFLEACEPDYVVRLQASLTDLLIKYFHHHPGLWHEKIAAATSLCHSVITIVLEYDERPSATFCSKVPRCYGELEWENLDGVPPEYRDL